MEWVFHTPVFVLTHHARAPIRMAGGTEFRFVTVGIHAALIDEMHLAVQPVLLGSGEHLPRDIDMPALGYECAKYVPGERAAHVFLRRRA